MGQTKRFLEGMYEEQDNINDLYHEIESAVSILCAEDSEKFDEIMSLVHGLSRQAKEIYRKAWIELEPQIKNDDSEILKNTERLMSVLLTSKFEKWIMKK
jgi:hypothetical protein